MDYRQISQGHRYELSGNTYMHKALIHDIGGSWNKEEKVWVLDLTSQSKSAYQARIANTIFKLCRSGVTFREA